MPENPFETYNTNLQTRKSANTAIIAQKSSAINHLVKDSYFMIDNMDKNKTRTFIHIVSKSGNTIAAAVVKNKYDQSGKDVLSSEQSYTENLNQAVFWNGGSINVSDVDDFGTAATAWYNLYGKGK